MPEGHQSLLKLCACEREKVRERERERDSPVCQVSREESQLVSRSREKEIEGMERKDNDDFYTLSPDSMRAGKEGEEKRRRGLGQ